MGGFGFVFDHVEHRKAQRGGEYSPQFCMGWMPCMCRPYVEKEAVNSIGF